MWQYIVKIALTTALVVIVAEVSKRSTFWGGILASLPIVSLLAFMWLYVDTGDNEKIATLSMSIFWLVLVSLPLFLVLPMLLRMQWAFWPSLGVASAVTLGSYVIFISLFGQKLTE